MDDRVLVRFMAKVDFTDDCWLWTASKDSNGYGHIKIKGKMRQSHRVAYEHFIGFIPIGLELDHLCRVRACVRPDHLEPVTHGVNLDRGAKNGLRDRTHCNHGHEWTVKNTGRKTNGHRRCRKCEALGAQRRRNGR